MYIFFINSGGKCDVFFSAQFNNNNKKKIVQPNPTQTMRVRLGWVGLGWVGLNFF